MVGGPGHMGLRQGAEPGPMCPASCASPAHASPAKFELYQEKGSVQKTHPSLFAYSILGSLPFFSPSLPRKVLVINSNFTSAELQRLTLYPVFPPTTSPWSDTPGFSVLPASAAPSQASTPATGLCAKATMAQAVKSKFSPWVTKLHSGTSDPLAMPLGSSSFQLLSVQL